MLKRYQLKSKIQMKTITYAINVPAIIIDTEWYLLKHQVVKAQCRLIQY